MGTVHDQRYAWTTLVARFFRRTGAAFPQLKNRGLLVALWRAGEAGLVERTLTEHEDMRGLIAKTGRRTWQGSRNC